MNDWTVIREHYLREAVPTRLKELATNLASIKSFSNNNLNCDVVASLIEESKFFIEWTAMDTGIDKAAELVELQVQLARWQFCWSNIWADDTQRSKVAEQAKVWSDRVLQMSGVLFEPITLHRQS